jgi:hypothetical protein
LLINFFRNIRLEKLVSKEKTDIIIHALQRLGEDKLSPVKEASGENILLVK